MKVQTYLPTGPVWNTLLSILHARRRLGYWPNIWAPKTYNEFILSEKCFFSGDLGTAKKITDKIGFKEWLIGAGLGEHVVPTIAVYNSVDECKKGGLPGKSVLKPTHSSGYVILNTSSEHRELSNEEVRDISKWLEEDYFRRGRELNYQGIVPRIIVEEMLDDGLGKPPSDIKVHCVNGEPFLIQVDLDRFSIHLRQLYTTDWHLLDYCTFYKRHPNPIERPQMLDKILSIARALSLGIKLCRVDFYSFGQVIKVGEITFCPGNGAEAFEPKNGDWELGLIIQKLL